MYHNIPEELRAYNQWVLVGANKEPINPVTKRRADVTIPSTWADFSTAVQEANGCHIGFVLTVNDPYCLIDLDNKVTNPATPEQLARHEKILQVFDSFTERSVSGRGYHIIVRGSIPGGVDQDHVGVYSNQRYMVMSGDVVRGGPIKDYHDLVNQLHEEATRTAKRVVLVDHESDVSDAELVDMASRAANGDKFNSLCAGYMDGYPSQSEADFALLSIIAFYTQDNEQVRRVFRMTALGKREKAQRDRYLNDALSKIRARQQEVPQVDLSAITANMERMQAEAVKAEGVVQVEDERVEVEEDNLQPATSDLTLPPGLIGELAVYFYQTAIRPVPEVAIAAAISIVAGVCGRSYNISGTGLNQYIILLARTGSGKEGALAGIESLLFATRNQVPMIEQFLGPAAFASGQALVKVLNERPCFVSVLGEFGLTLQQLSDRKANSASIMLRKVLLDLYAKSGWSRMLRSSVYSDTDKNTKVIQAPNVTILGESTPENFFDGLEMAHIAEGLIPRFSIIEYKGGRPPRNKYAGFAPPTDLVNRFIQLVVTSQSTTANHTCGNVVMDPEATKLMDDFDEMADHTMNASHNEVTMQLWNRAHLKALKLAALIAVGCNTVNPVVDVTMAQWAIDFVKRDIGVVHAKFAAGDVGQGDSKQLNDVRRVVRNYFRNKGKDGTVEGAMKVDGVIPYSFILRSSSNISSFRNDRLGSTNAVKRAIQALVEGGELVAVPANVVSSNYKFSGTAYGIGSGWRKEV